LSIKTITSISKKNNN